LRSNLASLAAEYAVVVPAAADEIARLTTDRVILRQALAWKIDVVATSQRVAFLPNAEGAFLGMVILSVGQRMHFTTGLTAGVFGSLQPIAAQAAERLESACFDIARKLLSPNQVTRLRTETEELVAQAPRGVFTPQSMATALSRARASRSLGWVMNVPLVPFRTLSGVSDTAQAINHFSETGRYFADTVAVLPQLTRWQLELVLHDLEDRETVRELLSRLGIIAESADEFATAAEHLPTALREQTSQLLTDTGAQQEELRTTLEQLASTAAHVGAAGRAWTGTLEEIRALQGPAGDAEPGADPAPGRPFDIREYEDTAQQIKEAAAELRRTIGALHELIGSSGTAATVTGLDGALARSEALVNTVAWRTVLVLLAFFVLLLTYRLAVSRLDRRGGSS
jgi:hypothetical protein